MKIALCSMVKDEINVIQKMYDSYKNIVNEFIFLDTGSTDGTVEKLKEFGTVFEQPFKNFVDSKNYLLKKVSEMPEITWIIFSDADEYMRDEDSQLSLLQSIKSNKFDVISTWINDVDYNGNVTLSYHRVRAWKNKKYKLGWKFEGPGVHEYLATPNNPKSTMLNDVVVIHDHKDKTHDYTARFNKYVEILNAAIKKNPNDTRAHFYLAQSYSGQGDIDNSIKAYENYLMTCNKINYHYQAEELQAMLDLSQHYRSVGKIQPAIDTLMSMCEYSNRIEPYFFLSKIYADDYKDYEKALYFVESGLLQENSVEILFEDKNYATLYLPSMKNWLEIVIKQEAMKKEELIVNQNIMAEKETKPVIAIPKIKTDVFKTAYQFSDNVNNYFDRIYVLAKNEESFQRVKSKLMLHDILAEEFIAYYPQVFNVFVDPDTAQTNALNSTEHISETLSYLTLLNRAKVRGYKRFLIIRDEVGLHKNFNLHMLMTIQRLKELDYWDIVHIGYNLETLDLDFEKRGPNDYPILAKKLHNIDFKVNDGLIATAFQIKYDGRDENHPHVVDHILTEFNKNFEDNIDTYLNKTIDDVQFNSYYVYPPLILDRQEISIDNNFDYM